MRNKRIVINALTGDGVDEAIREIDRIQADIPRKLDELCRRCAALGATVASLKFSRAVYKGVGDAAVSVEAIDGGYRVKADGEDVLFIEFGAGLRYGSGHPEAAAFGMGPGTWPDKHYQTVNGKPVANWESPRGWWLPREKGGGHTYGNPPAMAMYGARKEIEQRLAELVREVFSGD